MPPARFAEGDFGENCGQTRICGDATSPLVAVVQQRLTGQHDSINRFVANDSNFNQRNTARATATHKAGACEKGFRAGAVCTEVLSENRLVKDLVLSGECAEEQLPN